jgi:hypothetical protein
MYMKLYKMKKMCSINLLEAKPKDNTFLCLFSEIYVVVEKLCMWLLHCIIFIWVRNNCVNSHVKIIALGLLIALSTSL